MAKRYSPGTPAPKSGQYKPIGPKGGTPPGPKEITAIKGKPLPPASKPGVTYRPVDPTNNKSGRGA